MRGQTPLPTHLALFLVVSLIYVYVFACLFINMIQDQQRSKKKIKADLHEDGFHIKPQVTTVWGLRTSIPELSCILIHSDFFLNIKEQPVCRLYTRCTCTATTQAKHLGH